MAVFTVTGDQYKKVDRRMMEIKRQLRQRGGSPLDPELVADVLQEFIDGKLKMINPYANEEVASEFGYPEGFRIRTPEEQLDVWNKHFGDLDSSHVSALADRPLSEGAKGWGIIPKPSKVDPIYHKAFSIMLGLIAKERKFKNWQEDRLSLKHLWLTKKTEQVLSQLEEKTLGDFLVLPFQFGLRHRGKSVRRARALFAENEFGLGPYEVAALLVTHPDRISGSKQLYIDCAGVEYSQSTHNQSHGCLDFSWYSDGEQLALESHLHDYVFEGLGSVSAFAL